MRTHWFAAAGLPLPLLLLAVACSSSQPPAAAHPGAAGAVAITQKSGPVSVPYVPAGVALDATLEQPVDTRISSRGEPISAIVNVPVVASNGEVLIPAGAKLEGHVASIQHTPEPWIELEFDTLRFADGSKVAISARVLSAQQNRYRALPAPSGVTSMQLGATEPQGPEPSGAGEQVEITVPRGAMLKVALTTPVIDVRSIH